MTLTDRPLRRITDSNIVMASSSPQDVVNNHQSMEALPVDVSDIHDSISVPHGTNGNTPFTSNSSEPIQLVKQDGSVSQNLDDIDRPNHAPIDGHDKSREIADTGAPEGEAFEAGSVKSAGFDGLSSDTDTNKADSGKDAIPKYSVKKSGFKPASVTKSFLAKAGAAVPTLKATGDKGIPTPNSPALGSATSASRPRLVAKTLSSSRAAVPTPLNSSHIKAGADGPDPNQVWNRNRVQTAPQATPKHMTDEELRQQYGIQLASRPLEGADGNQAKWADLEDEDEDWAPETLEWSDGTKINLAPMEPATPVLSSASTTAEANEARLAAEKAAMPKASLGAKVTVLKLGGGLTQTKASPLTQGVPATPKGPNEKPTLVAKPTPAAPAKSPWAPLPPVEKVPPILPPTQQPTSRFPHRENIGREASSQHPSHQAREIAADDYSRSPANGTPRELFNSQSGRYEPAPESRRMSGKKEHGFRAPAVLQRPSQGDTHDQPGPSPAFQQDRGSQDAWRRRRASSNVSGDGGGFARRMSINRMVPEGFGGRRDSTHEHAIASGYGPSFPENRISSPAVSHGPSATSQQSPMMQYAGPAPGPDQYSGNQLPGTPATPMTGNLEAELARQKKLMKEKAEAAMKRRKDEEAKEELEKRERLRLKLQELEQKNAPAPSISSPTIMQKDAAESTAGLKATSPPKPPAPKVSGEPQQYGVMKLHGAHTANQPVASVGADGLFSQVSPPQHHISGIEQPHQQRQEVSQHMRNLGASKSADSRGQKPVLPLLGHQVDQDRASQLNQRHPAQSVATGFQASAWGPNGNTHPSPVANVWAAPGSQKTLGNGDFQKNITPIHLPAVGSQQYPQSLAQSQQSQPQPIGTPRQPLHDQPTSTHLSKEQQQMQHFPADLSTQSTHARAHGQLQQPAKDGSISVSMPGNMPTRPTGISAWADFAKNAPTYDAQRKAQLKSESAALAAERERNGLPTHHTPVFHETWTQVARGESLGSRQAINTTTISREFGPSETSANLLGQAPQMRSRYQDLFEQNERFVVDMMRPNDPLTPPPETNDHPAFIGGAMRPKVRLPGSTYVEESFDRPMPIVRLPLPSAYAPISAITTGGNRLPLSPVRYQPLVANSTWQERFNGLLLPGKSSMQKPPTELPGFSTSKEPLEQGTEQFLEKPQTARAPVSLPPAENAGKESMPDKSFEEESALLEEGRDFGSVPPVRIPDKDTRTVRHVSRLHLDFKRNRPSHREVDHGISKFSFEFEFHNKQDGHVLLIKLPNMDVAKEIAYTRSFVSRPARGSYQGGRGNKSRNTSGQQAGGYKARDSQSTGASPGLNTSHSSPRVSNRGAGSRKGSSQGPSQSWHGQKRTAPAPAAVH